MYKIDIEITGSLVSAHRKEVEDATRRAVLQIMNESVNMTFVNVAKHTPVGVTRMLINALWRNITVTKNVVTGTIKINKSNAAFRYANALEYGRTSKKWPPKGALLQWMILRFGVSMKEALRKEFLLRRSIAEHGTKPALMFFKGYNESRNRVMDAFGKLGKVIKEQLPHVRKRH